MDKLARIPLTASLKHMACVAGTTNTWTNTVASQCVIGSKFTVALATNSDAAETPTTDATTGAAFVPITPNKAAAVVFGVNAAGTLVASQGALEDTDAGVTTVVGAFRLAPPFPALPNDFCPIAYTLIRCAPSGGTGFVLGTTNWTASSMSCTTFANITTLPARPQIA